MGLQGIFDPVVRAYFKKHVGSAVDDGYCIEWDGNTEGRDSVSIDSIPVFTKVSNLIIDLERLQGCTVMGVYTLNGELTWREFRTVAQQLDGVTIVLDDSIGEPVAFSGKAGDYTFMGISCTVPTDGTYFVPSYGIRKLFKSTTL